MEYEISYEDDGDGYCGDILAININGHGHHFDDIELLLESMRDDELPYEEDGGCWEVYESYLRKVPTPQGSAHIYSGKGRGARAITVVERPQAWDYWCLNHPYEPARVGIPDEQIINGEALITQRLTELDQEIDPRRDVDRWEGRSPGYIYMCRECSDDFHIRLAEARKEALAKLKHTKGDEGP